MSPFDNWYDCYLIPVEIACGKVKYFIRYNDMGVEFSVNCLCELTDVRLSSVTKADWQVCHHVKKHIIKGMASFLML
jgi:hypothetical protein